MWYGRDITPGFIDTLAEDIRRLVVESAGKGDLLELSKWEDLQDNRKEKWIALATSVIDEVTDWSVMS